MDHHPQTPQDIVSFENSASQIVYNVIIIVLLHTYSEGLVKEQRHTFLLEDEVNSSNQSETTLLYRALLLEDHGESDQSGTGLEFDILKALTNGSGANFHFFFVSVALYEYLIS
jgi:hypothetical protein